MPKPTEIQFVYKKQKQLVKYKISKKDIQSEINQI